MKRSPQPTQLDYFVPHVSHVRANAGQLVALHVRQRVLGSESAIQRSRGRSRVVLFVHGGNVPVVPAFDLPYKDYSWMARLAREGFNVYGMDLSGYGASPRPMMDDPSNVSAECRHLLMSGKIDGPCKPNYPFESHTIRSDWAEMDTVVSHLLKANGVRKLSLVGWSAGGPRVGGYMALHPDKVDRAVLFAPTEPKAGLRIPRHPGPGAPTHLQGREELEKLRWDPNIGRRGQVESGVRNAIWKEILRWDPIGAGWGPGVMRSPNRTDSGWTPAMAARVRAAVLVITGELDRPEARLEAHRLIGSSRKAFIRVESASHFMAWEKQRHVLHAASLEWLDKGTVQGQGRGGFRVDWNGRYTPV